MNTKKNTAEELPITCPFCGGAIIRFAIDGRESSLCCDMPLIAIDGYEIFAGLPKKLQQVVIRQARKQQNAAEQKAKENELRVRIAWDRINPRLAEKELLKSKLNSFQG